MKIIDPLRDFIKHTEDRDLYKYLAAYCGLFLVLFLLFGYYHYRTVKGYRKDFVQLEKLRNETKRLLRDIRVVKAQQAEIEAVLAKDKDFRIGLAYQLALRSAGLAHKSVTQSTPKASDSVSGKIEVLITSAIKNITMKEVMDLLVALAQVPQLYVKEITLKKVSGKSFVDVDIVVATLEAAP